MLGLFNSARGCVDSSHWLWVCALCGCLEETQKDTAVKTSQGAKIKVRILESYLPGRVCSIHSWQDGKKWGGNCQMHRWVHLCLLCVFFILSNGSEPLLCTQCTVYRCEPILSTTVRDKAVRRKKAEESSKKCKRCSLSNKESGAWKSCFCLLLSAGK